ncbi:Odorant receptor 131-2, partial [Dissostichus eleginoides]
MPDVFIILATEPIELFYSTIVCSKDNLFRHPVILEKRDVSYIIYLIFVWLILLFTYFKIFLAAKSAKAAKSACLLMSNFTTVVYRDSLNVAIIKNVVTVVLCVFINYINGTLVHTFRKHQSLDFFRSRMFCLSANVFRNPVLKERRDVSNIVCLVIIWLTLFYTYFQIMCAAKAAAADTCLLMSNFTTVVYRDSLNVAIIKNVVTVVLCVFINYINGTLVHTFRKHQLISLQKQACLLMSNFTTVVYRDSLNVAIIKNVVTVVLCVFINYINGTLVHTFRKHQLISLQKQACLLMSNFTTVVYRDNLNVAIIKNVVTVVLCVFINYINGTLVHTFRKHQLISLQKQACLLMSNFTTVVYRDNLNVAIIKNVVTVVLCVFINYINGTLVHTFRKHQ